jgi:hypothetical protein
MRRVNVSGDERGAAAVLVALLMVVLLAFTAFAVDVGRLYAEKAQLQNGADSAALGIAQICSGNETDPLCVDDSPVAGSLASANANDSQSAILKAKVEHLTNSVDVVTAAQQKGLPAGEISLFFARFIEISSDDPAKDYSKTEVKAEAVATWGFPGSGTSMLPLVFQLCAFKTDGTMHWLDLKDPTGSNKTPSLTCIAGAPGNFHMVDSSNAETCKYFYAFNSIATSDPGMGKVKECEQLLRARLGKVLYLPSFDLAQGSGNNGQFRIDGWVAFKLEGFKLPSTSAGAIPAGASNFGLYGSFVKNSANPPELSNDGDTNYGVTQVRLVE